MSDAATMDGARRSERRYWRSPIAVWAILLGVLAHLAGFFAFSIDLPRPKPAEAPPAAIYYSGDSAPLDALMQEQSDLLDFEPLFLPTSRNASINLGWSGLVDRTEPFAPLPPKLLISSDDFPVEVTNTPEPLSRPLEMLERDIAGSFGAFGQMTGPQAAMPERAGMLEVYREGGVQPVVQQELKPGIIDEAVDNLSGLLEWRIAVGEVGIVGQPLLIRGSGLEAVDAAAMQHLLQAAPQWGLPSGYYRVVMGP